MKLPNISERLKGAVPQLSWPTLGKSVEIPVYVIHNSRDAEDYFFIFDFAQFVESSREGMFVRPKLKVWAGRDDFGRASFGRKFRTSFAQEFDAARAALGRGDASGKGWFSWSGVSEAVTSMGASWAANVVLLVATSAGKMVWDALPVPGFLRGKSDAAKLEDSINATQAKVDTALAEMEITLHKDLWAHAWRGTTPGRMVGIDYDAWPLPAYVTEHLTDGTSTSWW